MVAAVLLATQLILNTKHRLYLMPVVAMIPDYISELFSSFSVVESSIVLCLLR